VLVKLICMGVFDEKKLFNPTTRLDASPIKIWYGPVALAAIGFILIYIFNSLEAYSVSKLLFLCLFTGVVFFLAPFLFLKLTHKKSKLPTLMLIPYLFYIPIFFLVFLALILL